MYKPHAMKTRILTVIVAILFMQGIAGNAGNVIVRHYGTAEGMTHTRVRDMLQDSRGYMWFATWCGVERFDGYGFTNFRTYPGDSIKLDNNRIERIAEAQDGSMIVETYGHRIYRLDVATGKFRPGDSADSLAVTDRTGKNSPRPILEEYCGTEPESYVDGDGNLWIIRGSGVDYISTGNPAFNFVDSAPIDSGGEEVHALYAAPDGRIWTASRDTRVMLYDSSGSWLGNLSQSGAVVRDPSAGFGRRAYSFHADTSGRIWVGTKSKELDILIPAGGDRYDISRFPQSYAPGGLLCADIYAFATDRDGHLWLGTFGNGVAEVVETAEGDITFRFPGGYPVETSGRVRRLLCDRSGLMVGATTRGVIAFDPSAEDVDKMDFHFTSTEVHRSNSLSNDDILDICAATDGRVYFSAFSGGIDWLPDGKMLLDEPVPFLNMNIHNGLNVNLVLSVIQDRDKNFWVVSPDALSLYSDGWQLKSIYNSNNLGRQVRFTEAPPQQLSDGRLVFGRSGGILIVDPARLEASGCPPLVVTAIEAGGHSIWPEDGCVRLPAGVRDVAVNFTAIDFTGAGNIRYAYRLDSEGEWIELDHNRVLRLSALGTGLTTVQLRSTDASAVWCDNILSLEIHVPRTSGEIAEICLVIFSICTVLVLALLGGVRLYRRYVRRRRLGYYIRCVLAGTDADESDRMSQVCRIIRGEYGDASLKVESIAQRLDVGRNVLRRDVKERIGISLEDFLRLVRVQASAALLRESALTISEVAYRCGFKSPQYMSMVFKEHMGCSPTEYAGRYRKSRK